MEERIERWQLGIPDTFIPVSKLEKYLDYGIVKYFSKGSFVLSPGDEPGMLYYVLSGKLQLNIIFPDGRERMAFFGGKHSIFNLLWELHLLERYDHYVVAVKDSKVCCFTKEQLQSVFQLDGDIVFDLYSNIFSTALYFLTQAAEMDYLNPTIRIVKLIYNLCVSQGIPVNNHIEVSMLPSYKTIADITGVHYVTVSKVFCILKKKKILERKKDKLLIYDKERLKELMQQTQIFKHESTC